MLLLVRMWIVWFSVVMELSIVTTALAVRSPESRPTLRILSVIWGSVQEAVPIKMKQASRCSTPVAKFSTICPFPPVRLRAGYGAK